MPLFGRKKPNIEKMEKKRDVKGLCKVLTHENYHERCCATRALGRIRDKSAVEHLIGALKDPNENVRGAAVRALERSSTSDDRAVEPLVEILKDPDFAYRETVVEVLGKIGDERAVNALNKIQI